MAERDELLDPILLGASRLGARLFRNNSGIAFHKDGSVVSYGVGSPGGSDLIGWTPRLINFNDVGKVVAVFTAIEAKAGKTRLSNSQRRFLDIVNEAGGIGLWGRDADEILAELKTRP